MYAHVLGVFFLLLLKCLKCFILFLNNVLALLHGLVPQSGTEPPELEVWNLNHWTTEEIASGVSFWASSLVLVTLRGLHSPGLCLCRGLLPLCPLTQGKGSAQG